MKFSPKEFLKNQLLRRLRKRALQPYWQKLHHLAVVGMNYYGAGSFYSSGERHLLRALAEEAKNKNSVTVVDAGANQGAYALESHRVFGPNSKIFCLEPSPTAFRQLAQAVENTGISCFQLGLSSESRDAELYSSEPASTIASLYQQKNPLRPFLPECTEKVRLTTLDSFLGEQGIDSVDLLKLDLEGHEYPALLGATESLANGTIRNIQFEFGEAHLDARGYFRDFYDLLVPTYELFRVVSDGLFPIGEYNSELEIFAPANYLARLRRPW